MVRHVSAALALAMLVGIALLAGCGSGSSSGAAATTTSAPPAATTAPATSTPPTTAPAATAPAAPATAGDVVAGELVFALTCTGCHLNNGKDAGGIGPKLAGSGLDAARVRDQVNNGGGPMPAGLVTGTDLDNVVAYVVSLQ